MADPNQGDMLMERKMKRLMDLQAQRQKMKPTTFSFTEQYEHDRHHVAAVVPKITSSSPDSKGARAVGHHVLGPNDDDEEYEQLDKEEGGGHSTNSKQSAVVVVPDNWDEEQTKAGAYFRHRKLNPPLQQQPTSGEEKQQHHHQHSGSMRGTMTAKKKKKMTPAEKQEELDTMVEERVQRAIAEQKAEEERRRADCATLRHIERLKLHQRIRARTELQQASCQKLHDRNPAAVQAQKEQEEGTGKSLRRTNTAAALHKASVEQEPQKMYVATNFQRMNANLRHRELCLETMRERSALRKGLESHVGTYYSKKKESLLGTVGVTGAMATFSNYPTTGELHERTLRTQRSQRDFDQEMEGVHQEMEEVSMLDELLWDERRKSKGCKTERRREVPFSMSAPIHRTPTMDSEGDTTTRLPALQQWTKRKTSPRNK